MAIKKISKNQPELFEFSKKNLDLANKIIKNYPEGKQQSAVMALLYLAQKQNDNWIPLAAIKYISNHSSYKDASIGLLSICMGAASTIFAYGLEEEMKSFKNVKSMIAVQPLTYDYFTENMGLPMFLVNAGSKYSKEKRNIDLTGDSFLPYVKDVSIPTMLIQNQNDPMTDMGMVKRIYDDMQSEKEMVWLDLEKKRAAAYDWIGKNPTKILDWFEKYL